VPLVKQYVSPSSKVKIAVHAHRVYIRYGIVVRSAKSETGALTNPVSLLMPKS
jgi:hypothetical protein